MPVASRDSLDLVRQHADEVVCLHAPDDFYAVGQFYRRFGQVDDDEVVQLLRAQGSTIVSQVIDTLVVICLAFVVIPRVTGGAPWTTAQ